MASALSPQQFYAKARAEFESEIQTLSTLYDRQVAALKQKEKVTLNDLEHCKVTIRLEMAKAHTLANDVITALCLLSPGKADLKQIDEVRSILDKANKLALNGVNILRENIHRISTQLGIKRPE